MFLCVIFCLTRGHGFQVMFRETYHERKNCQEQSIMQSLCLKGCTRLNVFCSQSESNLTKANLMYSQTPRYLSNQTTLNEALCFMFLVRKCKQHKIILTI